ncbi:MAG: sigma-70 family RNA polymerase sigma factor [Planctomycetes bacterium]|nr:sigma-70 family RNA polymerase sigma factor [Planctomycetota bacterium]
MDLLTTATGALLERVLKGESAPLDRLFRRVGRRLMALISVRMSQRLRSLMEPEDVLQEVYIEALRQLPRFEDRGPGSFYAWLAAVAVNRIRNLEQFAGAGKRDPYKEMRLRGPGDTSDAMRGFAADPAADLPSPSQVAIRWEAFDQVRAALEQLPARERDVIVHRYLQGESTAETAEVLSLDANQVYIALSRGLQKVREMLQGF